MLSRLGRNRPGISADAANMVVWYYITRVLSSLVKFFLALQLICKVFLFCVSVANPSFDCFGLRFCSTPSTDTPRNVLFSRYVKKRQLYFGNLEVGILNSLISFSRILQLTIRLPCSPLGNFFHVTTCPEEGGFEVYLSCYWTWFSVQSIGLWPYRKLWI